MTRTMRSTASAALALALTGGLVTLLAEPASARDLTIVAPIDEVSMSRDVKAGDLDLTQAADVQRLRNRVRMASRVVCAPSDTSRPFPSMLECQRDARDGAEAQISNLVERSHRLAAAGLPTRIATTVSVAAGGR